MAGEESKMQALFELSEQNPLSGQIYFLCELITLFVKWLSLDLKASQAS